MMITMMNVMVMIMNLTEFLELFNTKLTVNAKSGDKIYLHTDGHESLHYHVPSETIRLYGNAVIPNLGSFSLQYEHDKKRIKYYRTYKLNTHKLIYVPSCDTEEQYFQNSLLHDHSQITFDNIQFINEIYEKVSKC